MQIDDTTDVVDHRTAQPPDDQRVKQMQRANLRALEQLLAELQKISALLQRWDAAGLPAREAA